MDKAPPSFKPHTLFLLLVAGCLIVYRLTHRNEEDTVANIKDGLMALCAVFLFFAALQFNDGIFTRPDPVLWRVVKGVGVLYLLFLVFLVFQNERDSRFIFTYIDPSLGRPLPERDYATDCRVFTPENPESQMYNIYSMLKDEFMLAHFLGWFIKTIIFRDAFMCSFLSVVFEFLEYSLAHVLPNFNECWWDHWVLDVAICNAVGILCGLIVLKKFASKEYNWAGAPDVYGSDVPLLKKMLFQFLPVNWTPYRWDVFSSPRRWFGFLTMCVMWAVVELNCFFLKYVLWHPTTNIVTQVRLLIWFGLALPGAREYYEWIVNPVAVKKVGTFAWLSFAVAGSELLVWVKNSRGQFDHLGQHPTWVVYTWAALAGGIVLFTVFFFYVCNCHLKVNKTNKNK